MSYADDTALVFSANTREELYIHAQKGFTAVTIWLSKNLLTLNADKTKYIMFTMRNHKPHMTNVNIYAHKCTTLGDSACTCPALIKTDFIKYLGVTLDANLNFRKHIDLLCTRVRI